jgi:hypothetical protein
MTAWRIAGSLQAMRAPRTDVTRSSRVRDNATALGYGVE